MQLEQKLAKAFSKQLTLDQKAVLQELRADIVQVAFDNPITDPVQFAIERAQMQGQVAILNLILEQD